MTPLPTMRGLLAEVAADYGLTVEELKALGNHRRVSWPRQDFMWRCRQVKFSDGSQRFSYPQIGRAIARNHATVIHGEEQHAARMATAAGLGLSVQDFIRRAMPPPASRNKVFHRPWTEAEDRALVWAEKRGVRPKHTCRVLGRSYNAVICRRHRLGLSSSTGRQSHVDEGDKSPTTLNQRGKMAV